MHALLGESRFASWYDTSNPGAAYRVSLKDESTLLELISRYVAFVALHFLTSDPDPA